MGEGLFAASNVQMLIFEYLFEKPHLFLLMLCKVCGWP